MPDPLARLSHVFFALLIYCLSVSKTSEDGGLHLEAAGAGVYPCLAGEFHAMAQPCPLEALVASVTDHCRDGIKLQWLPRFV